MKDLSYLVPLLEQDRRTKKFARLNEVICEIIEDFGLVSFETLCVEVRSPRPFSLSSALTFGARSLSGQGLDASPRPSD